MNITILGQVFELGSVAVGIVIGILLFFLFFIWRVKKHKTQMPELLELNTQAHSHLLEANKILQRFHKIFMEVGA